MYKKITGLSRILKSRILKRKHSIIKERHRRERVIALERMNNGIVEVERL